MTLMTQNQLNRQVAAVTGETVREVARRGFGPLQGERHEPDPEDVIVDWDALERERNVAFFDQPPYLTTQAAEEGPTRRRKAISE